MKIGIIGCGNMAAAMVKGMINHNLVAKEDFIASAASAATIERVHNELGIKTTQSNAEVAVSSDILFLAVKPIYFPDVIAEIRNLVKESTIIISIAAGQSIERIEALFSRKLKIVRTMPNTPALVSEGITAVCPNELITEDDLAIVMKLLSGCGIAEQVSERLMDAVVAVSGSAPAYIFMLIEAMADGAVVEGMPRDKAYRFAAQTVLGSAKMVLETGKHPGELKDMVCSPGGTTIEAVRSLEQTGFRSSIIEAMKVCADKCKKL